MFTITVDGVLYEFTYKDLIEQLSAELDFIAKSKKTEDITSHSFAIRKVMLDIFQDLEEQNHIK